MLTLVMIADLEARKNARVILFAVAPLVGRLQSARGHAALARRRELESHIQEILRGAEPVDAVASAAHDELCRMRFEHRWVPAWLYRRYVDRDRKAIDTAVARDTELWHDRVSNRETDSDRTQG